MAEQALDSESALITAYSLIPYNVIAQDLSGYLKRNFFDELGQIIGFYNIYHSGKEVVSEGTNGDYIPSDARFKKCRYLIDKESRFLFSNTPTITINKNAGHTDIEKEQNSILNTFVERVLGKNHLSDKLIKAAKDCLIGKRVACMLNFDEITGITLTFLKPTEFLYDYNGVGELSKLIAIYTVLDTTNLKEKQIRKKSYIMEEDGFCHVQESLFNGLGEELEVLVEDQKTLFTYIPGVVILNEGLTNDSRGESEIEVLGEDLEGLYSKLANADIDAERKDMNPIRYTTDASSESTDNLSSAPGAYWDLHSDQNGADPHSVNAGILEAGMNYSQPLKTTLDRIENQLHSQVDVPNMNNEQLQGMVTSGKTIKALYWGLIVRCNEKMLVWEPALKFIVNAILDGAILYPSAASLYISDAIPQIDYDIEVENNYPLPEDEQEEKNMDLSEVQAQTMSRKAYMKKWRELTDEEADIELNQILAEKQMFDESYLPPTDGASAE